MSQGRTLVATCLLSVVAFPLVVGARTHQSRMLSKSEWDLSFPAGPVQGEPRIHHRFERAAERSVRSRDSTLGPLTTMHIDARITRPIADDGCRYEAKARGSYRSWDLTGRRPDLPIRDVDVQAESSLRCGERLVRREFHRFVFSRLVSRQYLVELLNARLTTSAPGSPCSWSPLFEFEGGVLHIHSVASTCTERQSLASLRGYLPPEVVARGGGPRALPETQQPVRPLPGGASSRQLAPLPHSGQWWLDRRGTDSDEPTSEDARVGTH